MKNLKPSEAKKLLDSESDIRIIDVREMWEYEIVHLPNSELLPISDFQNGITKLNKTDKLLIYCHHGVRSVSVCSYLEQRGFNNVYNLSGGINAWSLEVDDSLSLY